jgi:hypothetical protein
MERKVFTIVTGDSESEQYDDELVALEEIKTLLKNSNKGFYCLVSEEGY